MSSGIARRRFVAVGVLGALEVATAGCGTVLHPERRGQAAGPLDWGVVALDAVGLFFFFIPGVIAFAVDFNNGTIYLPADGRAPQYQSASAPSQGELRSVAIPGQQVTPEAIEKTIAQETGRQVRLRPGAYLAQKLERLEEFWSTRAQFENS